MQCEHLPSPGETVLASSYQEISGGKGANQAVSAAKAGGNVRMIGRVGDDSFGNKLIENLESCGVDCTAVMVTAQCPSGIAVIGVEQSGQNAITVVSGANARLTPDDVTKHRNLIESCDVVLLQLEIPIETVLETIRIAKAAGVRVMLDPAPVPNEIPEELLQVDLICPNEHEAAHLTGSAVSTPQLYPEAGRQLHESGAKNVVLTLGEHGAFLHESSEGTFIKAIPTQVIDTTAAGDAFAGALAVYWAQGHSLTQAVRFGNAAGSIAASRAGAQPSMGSRLEIERLLGANS